MMRRAAKPLLGPATGLGSRLRAELGSRCGTKCHTSAVPTRHPRHSITETPPWKPGASKMLRRPSFVVS